MRSLTNNSTFQGRELVVLNNVKFSLAGKTHLAGNTIYLSLLILLFYLIPGPLQGQDYWANAPATGTKIFSISFTNDKDGEAVSAEGDVLVTTDSGKTWNLKSNFSRIDNKVSNPFIWKADIYCSVMQTTDGGKNWVPYNKEKQEHFCGVYLKDPNSGYKVASDFLNKVTTLILSNNIDDEINLLLNKPQQCTEYFRSADEGWALGWCLKNFDHQSMAKVKIK
jgi:hypothetical protein